MPKTTTLFFRYRAYRITAQKQETMYKDLRQKFQDVVPSDVIERDDKFYTRIDDYFENESKYGEYWKFFNKKLQPSELTMDEQAMLKAREEIGLVSSIEGTPTQFSYIDCIGFGVLAELQRWGMGLKNRMEIAEQIIKPYKHSRYGLFEFYAFVADFTENPVEVIVTRDKKIVVGYFYELASHKESPEFPNHISISLNRIIQNISQRKSNVRFNKVMWASKSETKILSALQEPENKKIEVIFQKGKPVNVAQTRIEKTTSVHEAFNKSSEFGELLVLKSNGKVSLIEHTKNIKL